MNDPRQDGFWLNPGARIIRVALVAAIAAAPTLARADGTFDINIDPATGYIIAAPGSHRLVKDVTMTADVVGIEITVSDVTLDLGGHTIKGPASSTKDGIRGVAPVENIKVHGGGVANFGAYGIKLRIRAVVRDCKVFGNNKSGGSGGINVGAFSTVEDCQITANSPTVSGSVTGIRVESSPTRGSSRIARNTISLHISPSGSFTGISLLDNSVVEDNIVTENSATTGLTGISAQNSIVRKNMISDNANSGGATTNGIFAAGGSIEDNLCRDNTGAGDVSGIRGNGISAIRNRCQDNRSTDDGNAYGVHIQNGNSIAISNICRGNLEGPNGNGDGVGIYVEQTLAGQPTNVLIEGNECSSNGGAGADGDGYGIYVLGDGTIRGNNVTNNDGIGVGGGFGILVTGPGALIENNNCVGHSGGVSGFGIFVMAKDVVVRGNTTSGNATAAIRLTSLELREMQAGRSEIEWPKP